MRDDLDGITRYLGGSSERTTIVVPAPMVNVPKTATMAVGAMTEPGQINTILLTSADLVALGRSHLWNPASVRQVEGWYGVCNQAWPKPNLPGREQAFHETERTREKGMSSQIALRRASIQANAYIGG